MTPTVRDVMVTEVISVHPETPILEAHEIISKHTFDGVPVVDTENKIVGILTEYDLLVKGSSLHLPTFQKVISELKIYKEASSDLGEGIAAVRNLQVKDVMNNDPLTLPDNASFEDVIAAFRDHHRVNPIPIIDKNKVVVGVVSRYDVLKLFDALKTSS